MISFSFSFSLCLILILLFLHGYECAVLLMPHDPSGPISGLVSHGFVLTPDHLNNSLLFGFGTVSAAKIISTSNNLYAFRPATGYVWLKPLNLPPTPRHAVVATLVEDNYFIAFGAVGDATDNTIPTNEMWQYHLPSLLWNKVVMNNPPPPRMFAAAILNPRYSNWVVFGGSNQTHFLSDTWIYHFPTLSWNPVLSYHSPSARYSAGISILNYTVYLFGGIVNTSAYEYSVSDLWSFDTIQLQWNLLHSNLDLSCRLPKMEGYLTNLLIHCDAINSLDSFSQNYSPFKSIIYAINFDNLNLSNYSYEFEASYSASFTILRDRMYILGRQIANLGFPISANLSGHGVFSAYDDFFPYSSQVLKNGNTVVGRSAHLFCRLYNFLIIYGGLMSVPSAEGFTVSLDTGVFSNMIFSGTLIPPLAGMAYVTYNNSIFVHGGYDNNKFPIFNFLKLDVDASTLHLTSPFWVYKWNNLSSLLVGDTVVFTPTCRTSAALISFGSNSYMIKYGGWINGNDVSDLFYAISLDTFHVTRLTPAMGPRADFVVISIGTRLVYFCGDISHGETQAVYSYDFTFGLNGSIIDNGTWKLQRPSGDGSSFLGSEGTFGILGAEYLNRYMVLYGGAPTFGRIVKYSLVLLDCLNWIWIPMNPIKLPRVGGVMVLIDSRLFISGGYQFSTGFDYVYPTPLLFVLSPLSTVVMDTDNGNNYQCLLNPALSSCASFELALNVFSSYSGYKQPFLMRPGIEYVLQLSINEPILIDSISIEKVLWNCGTGSCISYGSSNSDSLELNNINLFRRSNESVLSSIINIVRGVVTISNCLLSNSTSANGAAIFVSATSFVTLKNCVFRDLKALYSGGALCAQYCTVHIISCTFLMNLVSNSGLIFATGGAISAYSSELIITNSFFDSNVALGSSLLSSGGAISLLSSNCNISFCNFVANRADNGGAIAALGFTDADNTLENMYGLAFFSSLSSSYSGNSASSYGGAIYLTSFVSQNFESNTYQNNSAILGGGAIALVSTGPTTVSRSSFFSNNVTHGHGGGLYCFSSSLVVLNSEFLFNRAYFGGGGIFWSVTNIVNSLFIPIISSSNSFRNNIAGYGESFASNSLFLRYVNLSTEYPIQSVRSVMTKVSVGIYDYYGSLVSIDSESIISANPILSYSGVNVVTVQNGIASFTSLMYNGVPNTSDLLSFTSIQSPIGILFTSVFNVSYRSCTPGEFFSGFGYGCLTCPVGKYSESYMSSICLICPLGNFSSGGSSTCDSCQPGFYSPSTGAGICAHCGIRTFQPYTGSSFCSICPVNADSNEENNRCFCRKSYYSNALINSTKYFNSEILCRDCPTGADCMEEDLSYLNVLPLEEYYPMAHAPIGTVAFMKCINEQACTGGILLCAEGYVGPLCAVCAHGYTIDEDKNCSSCPAFSLGLVAFIFTFLAFLAFFVIYVYLVKTDKDLYATEEDLVPQQKTPALTLRTDSFSSTNPVDPSVPLNNHVDPSASLNKNASDATSDALKSGDNVGELDPMFYEAGDVVQITVEMIQFSSLSQKFNLVWPYPLSSWLSIQNKAVYMSSTLFNIQCMLNSGGIPYFYVTTVMFFCIPFAIAFGIFVSQLFYYLYRYPSLEIFLIVYFRRLRGFKLDSFRIMCLNSFASLYILLFLIYPDVVEKVFTMFQCIQVGYDPADFYLVEGLEIQCWTRSHYLWILCTSVPMLVFFVIGIPCSAFYFLWKNFIREKGYWRYIFILKFLFLELKPAYWWWSQLLVCRQISLIFIVVFSTDLQEQLMFAMFLTAFYMLLHTIIRPYNSLVLNAVELCGYISAFITFFLGGFLTFETSDTSRAVITVFILLVNLMFIAGGIYLIITAKLKECRSTDADADVSKKT